jgi:hypothetical protein
MCSLAVDEMYTFDIGNDALRDPKNIYIASGVPKCVAFLVSRVQ